MYKKEADFFDKLYCTQNLGHKMKVHFFMSKLTRDQKIGIYEHRQQGESISSLAKRFSIQESNIEYLLSLL